MNTEQHFEIGSEVKWINAKGTGKGINMHTRRGIVLSTFGNIITVMTPDGVDYVNRNRLRNQGEPCELTEIMARLAGLKR